MMKTFILLSATLLFHSPAFASTPDECIKKADDSRAVMLLYKDGKGDEAAVNQSSKDVSACIDAIEVKDKEKQKYKTEAIAAWKAFRALREGKILPTVVRYNQTAKDNKANLDKTKAALAAMTGNNQAADCIKKADEARAALLLYKDGKGDEPTVHKTAQATTACIENLDAKADKQHKDEALAAWKTFRSIREGKIVPDVKYFMQQSNLNTVNLNKTKDALKKLSL